MKSIVLVAVSLLTACEMQAQTNAPQPSGGTPPVASVKKAPLSPGVPGAAGSAAPVSTNSTPARQASGGREVRSQVESQRMQRISENLTVQKPNSRDLEKRRATGLFPTFYRTVKTGGNPLQLINPFAPVTPDEKDYGATRSRVFDDPKTHAAPGIDILSVSY